MLVTAEQCTPWRRARSSTVCSSSTGSAALGWLYVSLGSMIPPYASAARHTAYNEVIKGRNGIGLGPQADLAGTIAGVLMLEEERAVEIRFDVITHRHHPDRMPLPERRRLHA